MAAWVGVTQKAVSEQKGELIDALYQRHMPPMPVPSDFPSSAFDSFLESANSLDMRYRAANADQPNPDWKDLAAATNGLAYRWRALTEAQSTFNATCFKLDKNPDDRYIEETALFAFFASGVSAIEMSYFAFYAFASQIEPAKFSLLRTKPQDVVPKRVTSLFESEWPRDVFPPTLRSVVESPQYYELLKLRNILSHRGSPLRAIAITLHNVIGGTSPPQPPPTTMWSGHMIDQTLLPSIRKDVAALLNDLLTAAATFATDQIIH